MSAPSGAVFSRRSPYLTLFHTDITTYRLNRSISWFGDNFYFVILIKCFFWYFTHYATCPRLSLFYPWLSLLFLWLSLTYPWLSLLYPCLSLLFSWLSPVFLAVPGLSLAALCSLSLTMVEAGGNLQLTGINGGLDAMYLPM